MHRLVFGTNNPGKIKEIAALAEKFDFEILSLADIGVTSNPEETGNTFEENARLKLRALLPQVGDLDLWVAAEDAGLTIDYLNGEPGVKTRRWNGSEMSDQEVVDYALQKLDGVSYEQRGAVFNSVVAMAHSKTPQVIKTFTDSIHGKILQHADSTKKVDGLPFSQLFYVPEMDRMLGEVDVAKQTELTRSHLSHRQRAFERLFKYITDLTSIS